jgi:outer membrane usher protein
MFLFVYPLSLHASDRVIGVMKVIVNTDDKGEYFIVLTPEGDVLVRQEDLMEIGLRELSKSTEITTEQGEYVSLKSLSPEATFEIDEKSSSLLITADPQLLGKNIVDLSYEQPPDVRYTEDLAGFINYGIGYSTGDDFEREVWTIPWEAGISIHSYLVFSNFLYSKTETDERHVRLFSNITKDDTVGMRRFIFGDFTASTGTLGSGGVFGGLSISKNFSVKPYFIRSPGLDLSGVIETPSEVELYVNDILVRSERFPAGEFELRNLPHATGSGKSVLVIKDAYGHEERIEAPFYISTQLLKKGLHDYSYNLGFTREQLGQEDFKYGDFALLGFHRFGFSNAFTGGVNAEADENVMNMGLSASLTLGGLGETNASYAMSLEDERYGYGAFLSHLYAGRNMNARISLRGFSREYATLALSSSDDKARFEGTFGLGFNLRGLGAISASYSMADFYEAEERQRITLYYTLRLLRNASLHIRASRTETDEVVDEVFAGLTFFLGSGQSGSLNYHVQDDRTAEAVSFQQNPPLGRGYGYRFLVENREDYQGDEQIEGNGSLRYNGLYGIYSAGYRRMAEENSYDLNISGGIAFIDGSIFPSRPIRDSFALVKVGDLGDVRVNYSNNEVDTTNSSGEVIVPDLTSYYYNDISIDDKDIPVNYEIREIRQYVSPPLRGGSIVSFDIVKLQGFVGRFFIMDKGVKKAAEYWGLNIQIDDELREYIIGKKGEFYFENLPAGRYPATLFWQEKRCPFDITIPDSTDIMVDMGEVYCEMD